MATLKIKRSSEWANRARHIGIYADGSRLGTIANGETKEFELPEGTHSLQAKIDWCASEKMAVKLTENEPKKIRLSGYKAGRYLLPISLVAIVAYFLLDWVFNIFFWPLWFVILPGLAVSIYYLSFGRKKYLRMEKIS